jgi:hypothetical protein
MKDKAGGDYIKADNLHPVLNAICAKNRGGYFGRILKN